MIFKLLIIIFVLLIVLNYNNSKNIKENLNNLSINDYFQKLVPFALGRDWSKAPIDIPINYNFDWVKKESINNDNYYLKNDNYGYIKNLFNDKVKLNYMSAEEYYNKTSKK